MKAGDTVQLKSGGPVMTIREARPDGTAICDWFVQDKPQMQVFPMHSLREVDLEHAEVFDTLERD